MPTPRKKPSRRDALVGLGGLAVTAQVGALPAQEPARPLTEIVPIKGKSGPGMEAFDAAMLKIMDRHGIPGAALAITKDGRLVLAKGFGWSNVASNTAVEPDTLFGIASLSKSFTATAALKLVQDGKLSLDDRVFDILRDVKPPAGARVDPLLATVTVRQCLNHSGGWDRAVHGDPVNWEPQICRAYRVAPPLSPRQFIEFALTLPLNFKPGSEQKYSNVGYIILGEVIARASGQAYARYIIDNVLKPMGIKRAGLHIFDGKYALGEALRYLAGTLVALPPLQFPMIDASGGWSASVVDLARFLTNLDGSHGEPVLSEKTRKLLIELPPSPLKVRDNGTFTGLGWDSVIVNDRGFGYYKDGSYQGMRTYMKRLPDGVNWAMLFNASMEFDPQDTQLAANTVREVRELVEGIEKHSDIDLFKEYP